MHQFIGELLTSGNLSKNQPNSAWGVTPGLGFKSTSLQPLQTLRPVQDKRHENRAVQPGTSQRREDRGEGLDVRHACTCPSCPFSSPPSSFETLRARQPLPTSQFLQASCQPEDLRHSVSAPDTTTTSSNSSSSTSEQESSQPPRDDSDRRAQNQNSDNPPLRTSSGSLSHLSLFPCLCCHRSLQTCTQLLNQQGTDSPFSHTHHHFHHHHCPLTSCVPCPQIAHSAQLSAPIPCLSCQCSIPVCPQVCQHQHRQVQHREERSRNSTLLHPCMHCTASFSRPSQLLQHQRSEHAHKLPGFLCTECGRSFNSHSNLRIHLNVHTGARPYSCTDCGKCFSQSGALKIHRRIHTGERPYLCGFCGRGFPHLAGVRAHQRIHTGEKPYSCDQCGKCFTQSGALKIHTRIHTGERPFTCSLCGKGFSNRSGIRFHYRTVHGLTPEHDGEARAEGCSPGRPRSLPRTSVGLSMLNSLESESREASNSLGSSELLPADRGSSQLSGNRSTSQEGAKSHREELLYACEDCGLRFKDAPSRNKHQTLVHYSHEGREDEEEEAPNQNQ
uniref:C2H2-type domain-containing protein n=1 Tax=Iconisemion striatum TaxID=60296 RepID=A0A1A7WWC7_9TELE